MAVIRMSHPDHGYDIAYSNADVKRMKENGWSVQTKEQWEKILADKRGESVEEEDAPVVEKKKPGRKPKAE